MNNRFNIKLGLEEIEDEVVDTNVTLIEETFEPIETFSLSDISSDIREVEGDTEEVSQAMDTVTCLESIARELSNSLERGGLQKSNLKIVDLSLESLLIPIGIKNISLQSFDNPIDNVTNTKLAIESIFGKIVSIIKAIITSIKRGIEWVQKFIRHIFNKFEVFKSNIKTIRLALIKTTKDTPSEKQFKSKNVIRFLKSDDAFDLPKELIGLTKFSKDYFTHVNNESKKLVTSINEIIKAIPDKDIESILNKKLELKPSPGLKLGLIEGKALKSDNVSGFVSENTFPNNVNIFIVLPKDDLSNDDWNTAVKESEFTIHSDTKEEKTITDISILDKKDINIVLTNLEELCNESINSKKDYNDFIKSKNSLVKDLEYAVTKYSNSKTQADSGSYITSINARMRLLDNIYVNGTAHFSNYITKVLSSGIAYTDFCVKAYA
jgi:hypothetical protein